MKPTRTTVGRPQEMLLYASRRCRSTTSVQCLGTFQLGGVHSIHHQIFESQLIIRHCFSFFLLKDAMISDGLGMADLCVGGRSRCRHRQGDEESGGRRPWCPATPLDAATLRCAWCSGRGHRLTVGPRPPQHRRTRSIPCAGCVGFPDVTFAWPILPCVYIQ